MMATDWFVLDERERRHLATIAALVLSAGGRIVVPRHCDASGYRLTVSHDVTTGDAVYEMVRSKTSE